MALQLRWPPGGVHEEHPSAWLPCNDLPLHGVYYQNHVYEDVTGWHSFEPLISRIEEMDYADLWRCATQIPLEWFEHDGEGLFWLVENLHSRLRSEIRCAILFQTGRTACRCF